MLDLLHGIPSHDTFERVFGRLDPDAFERRRTRWMKSVVETTQGKLLAIDGKSIRRSLPRRLWRFRGALQESGDPCQISETPLETPKATPKRCRYRN